MCVSSLLFLLPISIRGMKPSQLRVCSADGHLGCYQCLTIMNKSSFLYLCFLFFLFPLGRYVEESRDHGAVACLTFHVVFGHSHFFSSEACVSVFCACFVFARLAVLSVLVCRWSFQCSKKKSFIRCIYRNVFSQSVACLFIFVMVSLVNESLKFR